MEEDTNQPFAEDLDYLYVKNEELRVGQRVLAGLVGAVALLLPISLILFGEGLTEGRDSISAYYYESIALGDIFVGGLFLVGGLMLTYRGNSQSTARLATIGGLLAMLIAAFPTSGWSRCTTLFSEHQSAHCISATGEPWLWEGVAGTIHIVSAISLFVVLALFCYFVFLKPRNRKSVDGVVSDNSGDDSKKLRNKIYWLCFLVLIGAMIAMAGRMIVVVLKLEDVIPIPANVVFWGESAGLVAFGVAWLTHSRWFFNRLFRDQDDPVYWGFRTQADSGSA